MPSSLQGEEDSFNFSCERDYKDWKGKLIIITGMKRFGGERKEKKMMDYLNLKIPLREIHTVILVHVNG